MSFIQVDPDHNPDYVMSPGDEVPRLATAEEREILGLPPREPQSVRLLPEGVDAGVFTTVCHERDVAQTENRRLRELLARTRPYVEETGPPGTMIQTTVESSKRSAELVAEIDEALR